MRGRRFWGGLFAVLTFLCLISPSLATAAQDEGQAQGPGVQIIAPEDGCAAAVGDKLTVMLVMQGGLKPTQVAVMVDARGIGIIQAPPYQIEWDTTGMTAGEHVLRAFAYTESGERIGAKPVVVNLSGPVVIMEMPEAPSTPQIAPVVLKEGAPVLVKTVEAMTSGHVQEGATVRLQVARDVTGPDGCIVIPYDAAAQGRVTRSRRRGMFGKAGQLEFTIDSVEAADGTQVPLRASQASAGTNNRGAVIATALLLTVFTIFVNGQDVTVPAGTEITAYVDHVTEVKSPLPPRPGGEVRGTPEEQASITQPAPEQTVPQGSELQVEVKAAPENKVALVKLFADGKEVYMQKGTPKLMKLSTRSVSSGSHSLEAEVQFASGRVIRTMPVKFTVGASR